MTFRTQAMLMKKAAAYLLLIAGISVQTAAPAFAADSEIVVPLHRAELISVSSDLSEAIIADPSIADIYVHGQRKLSIIGKARGRRLCVFLMATAMYCVR